MPLLKLFNMFKIVLPLTLLTGCGFTMTKVEINQQTFVFAMYVDKGQQDDTVEVTISAPFQIGLHLEAKQASKVVVNRMPR